MALKTMLRRSFLALLASLLAGSPANASYLFNATAEYLQGTFTSTYVVDGSNAFTITAFVLKANWGSGINGMVRLTETGFTDDPSISLYNGSGADRITAAAYDGGSQSAANHNFTAETYDGVWVRVTGVWTSNVLRDVYIEDSSNTAQATTSKTLDAGDVISVGNHQGTFSYINGNIADVCMWNIALTTGEVDSLQTSAETGPACATIQSGSLVGSWPLDTDRDTEGTILNEGSDAGGDLTITSATYAAAHPTITVGSSNTSLRRKRSN